MRIIRSILGLQVLIVLGCSNVLDSTTSDYEVWVDYSISSSTHVHLYVHNSYDVVMSTVVNEIQDPGNYCVILDFNEYPEGVYYYFLEAGDFRDSRMVLVIL